MVNCCNVIENFDWGWFIYLEIVYLNKMLLKG